MSVRSAPVAVAVATIVVLGYRLANTPRGPADLRASWRAGGFFDRGHLGVDRLGWRRGGALLAVLLLPVTLPVGFAGPLFGAPTPPLALTGTLAMAALTAAYGALAFAAARPGRAGAGGIRPAPPAL